jgi:hypothetical protein
MKEIQLTQGKVALVDDADFEWLNQWKWCAIKQGKLYYAIRKFKGKNLSMHRFVLGTPKGMLTDHRDHNGLNNQRYNLRFATKAQNTYNVSSRGHSKYLGVSIKQTGRQKGKISAKIQFNRRPTHIGSFPTEIDAARAYDLKAKELFGEFANLNFK